MDALADRAELVELLGRYADIADLKEYTELPGLVFADPVTLDFEAVAGIPPMTTPVRDYVEVLRASFAPVRAEHWVPDTLADGGPNRWLVAGFYDNEAVRTADGWRLSRVKLTSTY